MTSSNGNIFRVTDHFCGEFTGHRWIPHTKASDAELWVKNREAGDLRRHLAHYDITVMYSTVFFYWNWNHKSSRADLLNMIIIICYVCSIILCMRPANGKRRYNVTSSLIGCDNRLCWTLLNLSASPWGYSSALGVLIHRSSNSVTFIPFLNWSYAVMSVSLSCKMWLNTTHYWLNINPT